MEVYYSLFKDIQFFIEFYTSIIWADPLDLLLKYAIKKISITLDEFKEFFMFILSEYRCVMNPVIKL